MFGIAKPLRLKGVLNIEMRYTVIISYVSVTKDDFIA